MRQLLLIMTIQALLGQASMGQCSSGGAEWLYTGNNGLMTNTGLLGGYVTVNAVTVGTMVSGRPLYQTGSSVWKSTSYSSLQVWRAYSSPGSNYTSFRLDQPLDSTYFHVRVDNIRGDAFNWESQNVRGYRNGIEVPADFKDPVNGATVSNNTISGASNTTSTMQSAMRVFFRGPVDSVVVRQTSWSDWVIIELMVQCNILLSMDTVKPFARPKPQRPAYEWKVYPNPCSSRLMLQLPRGCHSVEVINPGGQRIHASAVTGQAWLDTSSWPDGIYLIRCTGPGGTYTEKIMKRR